jgi:hypothetical protein
MVAQEENTEVVAVGMEEEAVARTPVVVVHTEVVGMACSYGGGGSSRQQLALVLARIDRAWRSPK